MILNEEKKEMLCDFTQFQSVNCMVERYYWQFTEEHTLEAAYQNYWVVTVESNAQLSYWWESDYKDAYDELKEPITEEQLQELGFHQISKIKI